MRYNISRLFGVLVGIPVAFIVWMVTVFAWDLSFLIYAIVGAGGFLLSYFPTQRLTSRKYLNEIGLSRRDYRYVRTQLNQAQLKIRTILKSFMNIISIKDFRQVNDIYRISRSIYTSIKQRPGMFFKVEGFFYSHLDNALNLVDSYTRLSRMPRKSKEEKQKLEQTRITLDEVKRTLIADLKRLNEEDYERLDVEMELNKLEQERRKDV
ncbi:5-bromo-4-chloroindolyl phosphate hydrolysis family protein [Staphylococcus capitis]|uniref:5-bromo-4-chloroindolyl phosphate hydrolysis family protein n=1 Tax=Staphylococcus capitis TaxID=29388 RepID=UPI0016435BF6|nr:5-bromo-4-chloroindolyl phosphate hydrolysis family protein [Staphylococcus capitis]MBC3070739.1 5-bromo-4-chloroindolyl phosphate hydrolysis family protein [Staphylococcus capitis]MBC3081754.1 5-bromo-4-chloroindolyl phosphate hydrolysis family protein [Staphylococcus capitis]MDH9929904.1 5-bromo-4-chloroindolyl phosphate hydrolysis family protein [Staphylococcus capitis]MDH9975190.1 5-bromo-4-chloroindolyl phosphate hydrolysis family protein [Staphylococcus capitis]MDI0006456.1 5-bromo-4-